MKILIFTNDGGGLYKFRKELLTRLALRHEVFISLPVDEYKDYLINLGVRFIITEFNRRGTNPIEDLKLLHKYITIIRGILPDIVLTYTIKPNVYGGLACRLTKTPYLANVTGLGTTIENGRLLSKLAIILYKAGLKKASCVFFQNKPNRDLFVNRRIINVKTRLIPGSGVNLEAHNAEPYPDDKNGIKFLFIGRVMKDKGIKELLQAIKAVKEKYPSATLDIIGSLDEDYSKILRQEEDAGYIKYHGSQQCVHEFIKASHCTVLPSYHEGTANVLLESASTARPVIATHVTGCNETFDEGITGIGCKVRNADDLAEKMVLFIELPYSRKVQMGLAGRKKMEAQFDRSIVIQAYLEEIGKIINK